MVSHCYRRQKKKAHSGDGEGKQNHRNCVPMLAHAMDSPVGSMRRRPRLGPNPGPRCLLTLGEKHCYLCDPSWIGWTCPRCGVTWRAPAAERQPHGTASASTAPGVPLGPGAASSAAAPGAAEQPAEHSREGVAAGEGYEMLVGMWRCDEGLAAMVGAKRWCC